MEMIPRRDGFVFINTLAWHIKGGIVRDVRPVKRLGMDCWHILGKATELRQILQPAECASRNLLGSASQGNTLQTFASQESLIANSADGIRCFE